MNQNIITPLVLLVSVLALFNYFINTSEVATAAKADQPIEIGLVEWNKDFDEALALSAQEKKPLFALFQEVPGCAGCKSFGQVVLSNPLIVEAVETEFIPAVIYNNRSGKDAELLSRFKEPSWNYQVIRFFDKDAKDIIPRKDKVWSIPGVAKRMTQALETSGLDSPTYLNNLSLDLESENVGQVVFSQHCFWTGERKLGSIEGVVKTEAGFYRGHEVTRVWYLRDKLPLSSLVSKAKKLDTVDIVYAPKSDLSKLKVEASDFVRREYRPAPDSDQKKQIQGTAFSKLEMSDLQKTKVNAFARTDRAAAMRFLSPRQIKQLQSS